MAAPRIARTPTCLSCLRRLAQPSPSVFTSPAPITSTWAPIQTRARSVKTKAELEDLKGLPVRLLRDVPTFGRKDAIIRVKAGRMRNLWFPEGIAEYMTRNRFAELGLTESAIGTRDRNFGVKIPVVEDNGQAQLESWKAEKKMLTLQAEDAFARLSSVLPESFIFPRRAQAPPPAPTPAVPRSPSLAYNAVTSTPEPKSATTTPAVQAIFGSVTRDDIVAYIQKELLGSSEGGHVALTAESVEILGLDPEHDGEDRIKRLGSFEILIKVGDDAASQEQGPLKRVVEVVPEEDDKA